MSGKPRPATGMRVTVLGCGDAFGSGGRLQTAFLIDVAGEAVLLDCGATVLIGLERAARRPNDVGTILVTHLHGDHFGGLVWLLLHAQYISKRTQPLAVFGPPGIEARTLAAAEALFPGSTTVPRRFLLTFHEMYAGRPRVAGPLKATAFEVEHPSGAPSHALRLQAGKVVVAFSGDTQWVDALMACARGADLYISECFTFDTPIPYHITWASLAPHLDRIGAKKVMLTHMSHQMLTRRNEVTDPRVVLAEDGMIVDL